MFSIVKRDGEIVKFQLGKIITAIKKAFKTTGRSYTDDIIELLSIRVTSDFQGKMKDGRIPVEDTQDSVKKALEEAGYIDVAEACILHRKQREEIRNLEKTALDYKDVVDNYVKMEGWRMKENSTTTYSVGGLILNDSGAVIASYWLTEIYNKEVPGVHLNGSIRIHDLSMLTSYSCGWLLKKLLLGGLGGITGKITASPAKHLATLCNQIASFLGITRNEWVASQSFSSSDTYLASFVKSDNLSYDKVKKCTGALIFGVNAPSRWGTQASFSHVSMDPKVSKGMAGEWVIVGGEQMDFTYGNCQEEMNMINKAFLETVLEGNANGQGLQCPIPAYGVTSDFDWSETEQNRLLFSLASRYGTPYFISYTRSSLVPEDVRISCQRTRSDSHVLHGKTGGFFGYGEHTGAIGAVTINLPRVTFQSRSGKESYERLDHLMDLAARSLNTKRRVVFNLLKNGLYPYTTRYLSDSDNHFSSIGVTGMNEAGLNTPWLRTGVESEKTRQFAVSVLNHMRERLVGYQLEYRTPYGLEVTPAGLATFRFARLDRERFLEIRTGGRERNAPYYINSTELPADHDIPLEEALANQDEVQPLYTTGTVFHIYVEQELEGWRRVRDVVFYRITEHTIFYCTPSPVCMICQSCDYLPDRQEVYPECGTQVDTYGRIAGYYRPVHDWNDDKARELRNRIMYRI